MEEQACCFLPSPVIYLHTFSHFNGRRRLSIYQLREVTLHSTTSGRMLAHDMLNNLKLHKHS